MHYQAGTERTTRNIRQCVAFGDKILEVFKVFLYLGSHVIPNNVVSLEIQRSKQTINFLLKLHNQKFTIINDMLCSQNENYRQWHILVPKASLEMVIKHFHERRGHLGVYKTYKQVAISFTASRLKATVKRFVKTCTMCQKT
jgi:Integrase zinc binding domain